jgi:hypothetical protein
MMTQHKTKEVYSVNNTKLLNLKLSSQQLSAMSIEFLSQQALTVAHVVVSMNFNKRRQMSKK